MVGEKKILGIRECHPILRCALYAGKVLTRTMATKKSVQECYATACIPAQSLEHSKHSLVYKADPHGKCFFIVMPVATDKRCRIREENH